MYLLLLFFGENVIGITILVSINSLVNKTFINKKNINKFNTIIFMLLYLEKNKNK